MTSPICRCVACALAIALLAGCDSNPDGPRVPQTPANAEDDGQPAAGETVRRPVTKSSREIVNPE